MLSLDTYLLLYLYHDYKYSHLLRASALFFSSFNRHTWLREYRTSTSNPHHASHTSTCSSFSQQWSRRADKRPERRRLNPYLNQSPHAKQTSNLVQPPLLFPTHHQHPAPPPHPPTSPPIRESSSFQRPAPLSAAPSTQMSDTETWLVTGSSATKSTNTIDQAINLLITPSTPPPT